MERIWVFLLFFGFGCVKDVGDDYSLLRDYEPMLSEELYLSALGSGDVVYGSDDLLEFLSVYGLCDEGVLPAFGNYFQDIGVGGSLLGNLTLVGGDAMFSPSGVPLLDTLGYSFSWYANDSLVYSYSNPTVSDVQVCSGVFSLRLEVVSPVGNRYVREQWAFLGGGDGVFDCPCDGCPFFFEVFYDFHPDVDAYFFLVEGSEWDFDGNGCVDISDMIEFLSRYGG